MTPDNDKTLRGLFTNDRIGHNEWNDRRDYREKYESKFSLRHGKVRIAESILEAMLAHAGGYGEKSIIHDKGRTEWEVENETYQLYCKIIPEAKTVEAYIREVTYGYGDTPNPTCDCCGKRIHLLNSVMRYHMCHECDTETAKHRGDTQFKFT
jgi:hypothetical protein